jgi:hypothetical protein
MHSYPAGNALAQLQVKFVYQVSVGILGSAQHQLLALENVNETGIAHHHRGDKINNPFEHSMKRIRRRHAAADLVQELDIPYFFGPGAFFGHYHIPCLVKAAKNLRHFTVAFVLWYRYPKLVSVPVQRPAGLRVVYVLPVET